MSHPRRHKKQSSRMECFMSEGQEPLKKPKEKTKTQLMPTYYSALSKFKSVSIAEEKEFFDRYLTLRSRTKPWDDKEKKPAIYYRYKNEEIKLRNAYVERNLKFVIKIAKNYWLDGAPESFDNLVASGNIGLIRAVDRFDPSRGNRFLTYAVYWITLEIRLEVANDTLLKIPIWWQKVLKKLYNHYHKLVVKRETESICVKELARVSEVSLAHVIKLSLDGKTINKKCFPSLKADVPFLESAYESKLEASESQCVRSRTKKRLYHALDQLPSKEQMVIKASFGLGDIEPKNLRQISNVMGNTGERVRQIREKGLDNLKEQITSSVVDGGFGIDDLDELY